MWSVTLEYVNHLQRDNIQLSLTYVGICVPPRIFWRGPQEAPVPWLEFVNHLQRDNIQLSLTYVGICVPPRIFWRGPQEAPVPWLELGRKCCHFSGIVQTSFCLAFLCPSNVVEHRHEYDPFIDIFWILPVSGRSTGSTCQMNCTLGLQIQCSLHTSSSCVAQLLDGFGFENPTHNVKSKSAWTFFLINFAAGSPSNVFLDHHNVSHSCRICILYASVRSINIFTCGCTGCIRSCVLGKLSFIAILRKSSWSFVSQDEAHKQSPVNWLQIAALSGEFWRLVRYLPKFAQKLFNTWL